MKKANLLIVGAALVASLVVAAPALAWHPQVDIVKKVQNVTAAGVVADANTNSAAVAAKPGDTLKYVLEISNPAKPAEKEWNHLYYTVVTDELPAGIELVNNPSQRKITENIGVLAPGAKVTKEYLVKVTSQTNGAYITNKACVAGDSKVKDAPRSDCDNAVVKVNVPVVPPTTPEEPKTPETPKTPEAPVVIPSTGPESIVATAFGASALGYGVVAAARSKRLAALLNK